jgi:Fe-S-cluster-containing dehydrogenase component/CRP-like cAMP-binding protein
MAKTDTNLSTLVSQAQRPNRWEQLLDPNMSEEIVDELLTREPFASMDPSRFPSGTPLRDILRCDTAVRNFDTGGIVIRKDDYGTSAYLVLDGEVDVVIRPEIDPRLLGRSPSVKKGFIARFAQLWSNSAEPEVWKKKSRLLGDKLNDSYDNERGSVYLQDYPRIVSGSQTAKLGAGSMFGEISALSRMPRTATVVAVSPNTRLLEFSWEGLRDIMKYDPALKARIDKIYRENSLKSFLSNHPLFSHLDEFSYRELCDAAQLETYGDYNWSGAYKRLAKEGNASTSANEPIIVKENDYLNGIHMIRAGFCRVSRKLGGGECTLNYIGAGSVFGFEEIANHWKNVDCSLQSTHSLRSLGYAHLIFIPTAALEKFANRKWAENELVGGLGLPDVTISDAGENDHAPSAGLMEFMAEHRFLNGTKSMVIDMDRCTRCDDCVRACASTHDGNPRFLRHGPIIDNLMIANACMHCVDPVCMIGCPTGAIHRTSFGGEVVINPGTCIGCGACAANCPYDSIRMVEVRSKTGEFIVDEAFQPILKATKCDFCVEQTSGPACMNACPHDALSRTDLTRITPITQWLKRK